MAAYLSGLKSAAAGRGIVQLPFGDPDLMGVADGKGTSLLTAANTAAGAGDSSILGQAFGVAPTTDVAWPAGGWADAATITAARRMGAQAVVLAASSRPPSVQQSATPSSLAPLSSTTDGLLYDDVLSSLLMHTSSSTNGVLTVQRFLAETLATVGERPAHSRIVLVAPLRSFNPNPAVVRELFAAVAAAPWIKPASLARLRSGAGDDEVSDRLAPSVPASVRKSQITATQVTAVRKARAEADDLADVIPGDPVLAEGRTDALRLVSTALRSHRTTATRRVKALHDSLLAQGAKVRILPLSHLNFLTSDGNLTLSVANDLDLDVHKIRVVVQPANGRLVVVRQPAAISVDAGRRTTIKVHVHAVAGGLVPVTARIVTPTGIVLGAPVTVQVHVRPTDSWAFWVLGVAAGLVFVVGLLRTLRRGRSRPRLQAPEVSEL